MRLQLSSISPMDHSLLNREVSPEDFNFYRKHTESLKQMWDDQGVLYWRQFVVSFAFFTLSTAGAVPDLPSSCLAVVDAPSGKSLWTGLLDEMTLYLMMRFAQGTFSSAKTVFKDGCTLAEHQVMLNDIGRSRTKDPFFHKSTREVYRRVFGEPSAVASIKATMMITAHMRFSGAVVEIMRRWMYATRANVSAQQTPGDMRGMCLIQFLLDGVTANCDNMQYLESLIRKKLLLPDSAPVDPLPADAKGVDKAVSTIFSPVPPNNETHVLTQLIKRINRTHPEKNCQVCHDKAALLTRITGNIAGRKEITFKLTMVCKDTVVLKSGMCHRDCQEFKYRATCMTDACAEGALDTIWSNFAVRSDTCLAKLKMVDTFPLRAQTSLVFIVRCLLEGQRIAYGEWEQDINTLPFIHRLWQIKLAFLELLYEGIRRVEDSVVDFSSACERLQKILSGETFDESASRQIQQFIACIAIGYTSLANALCFAWTICGLPEDSHHWLELEPSMRVLATSMLAKSGVVNLTGDSEGCIRARRSCVSVLVALRILASHIGEHWPIAYRLISILQSASQRIEHSRDGATARSLIRDTGSIMDQEMVYDFLRRSKLGKPARALHMSIKQLEADLQMLPMELGQLEAKHAGDEVARGRNDSGESVPSFTIHSCQFKAEHLKRNPPIPADFHHKYHRNDAKMRMDALKEAVASRRTEKAKQGKAASKPKDSLTLHGQLPDDISDEEEEERREQFAKSAAGKVKFGSASLDSLGLGHRPTGQQPGLRKPIDIPTDSSATGDSKDTGDGDDDSGQQSAKQRALQRRRKAGEKKGTQSFVRFVREDELAGFDKKFKSKGLGKDDDPDEAMRAEDRPRINYSDLDRANFTFDGYTTLENSPVCTTNNSQGGGGRVNIDVSLKDLNPSAYHARLANGLSGYVPLYSGDCRCSSPVCLKVVNPLVAPSVISYNRQDGPDAAKKRSSKSERARRKEENRLAKVKMKSSAAAASSTVALATAAPAVASSNHSAPGHSVSKRSPVDKDKSISDYVLKSVAEKRDGDNFYSVRKQAAVVQIGEADSANSESLTKATHVDEDSSPTKAPSVVTADVANGRSEVKTHSTNIAAGGGVNGLETHSANDPPVQPEKDTAVQPEKDIAVQAEKDTAVQKEKDTAVQPEKDTTVQPEKDTAVQPEKDTAVQPEKDTTVQSAGDDLAERKQRLHTCSHCGDTEPHRRAFKKCKRCTNPKTTRYYCSRTCQGHDWTARHREEHAIDDA